MEEVNKQLVILDFDGVIIQGNTDEYIRIYQKTLENLGIELPPSEAVFRITSNWGSSHRGILRGLLKERPELSKAAESKYEEILTEEFADSVETIPGYVESLGSLAAKYTLAINSAANRRVLIEKVLPKINLPEDMFRGGIITADDLSSDELAKPHPHSIQYLMDANRVEPHNTLMVGDSGNDVLAAFYAGVEPVVTLTGNLSRKEAKTLEVNYIIDDITQLEPLVPRVLGRSTLQLYSKSH